MKRPNILMIFLDDMGWRDLQCFGSTFYETPNIDALAAEGMIFSDAYASCPVCSPSRASLLSGKYPAHVGVTQYIGAHDFGKLKTAPYTEYLPLEEHTLSKVFAENGYHTWCVGKWHLGRDPKYYPEHQGFEKNYGGCYFGHPQNGYFAPWGIPTLPDENVPEGTYLTDYLTDRAIDLVRNNRDGKPFFLYWAQYAVHTPIQAKEEDIERFRQKSIRMKLDSVNPMIVGEHFPNWLKHKKRVERRFIQSDIGYAAMIWNLDQNIGRMVQTLKDEGIYDDTIIVFTSDNGGLSTAETSPTCNSPLSEGKGWGYEGGVRVPAFVVGAGIEKNTICRVPTTTPDWYPTLLEFAGIKVPDDQEIDGVSIVPLLKGEKIAERPLFWHYPHYGNQGGQPVAAVRFGNYKLLKFFEDNHTELYNLANDISESFDLTAEMPEKSKELLQMLEQWLKDVKAVIPEENVGVVFDYDD